MKEIYFFCYNDGKPAGGIRRIYRQVDILNAAGFRAFVLHPRPGMRCSWFENSTPLRYAGILPPDAYMPPKYDGRLSSKLFAAADMAAYRACGLISSRERLAAAFRKARRTRAAEAPAALRAGDILVLPEIYAEHIGRLTGVPAGVRKVIFNQNVYYTFIGRPASGPLRACPYTDGEVEATITVSDQNLAYFKELFPGHKAARIRHGIDPEVFRYSAEKRPVAAYMSRKLPLQVQHVVNALRLRGRMTGFEFKPIDGFNERETARAMSEAALFLSFSTLEGFGLPPAEAMACGCVVAGYHGNAGREYFDPSFSYPVQAEDVQGFIKAAEDAAGLYASSPEAFREKGRLASRFIMEKYSPDNERSDILSFWRGMLAD